MVDGVAVGVTLTEVVPTAVVVLYGTPGALVATVVVLA